MESSLFIGWLLLVERSQNAQCSPGAAQPCRHVSSTASPQAPSRVAGSFSGPNSVAPETINMVDASAIAAMKPGCALVNIGRGNTIDEAAMTEALRRGHIAFAALDVATVEPLPPTSPLWDMPNVVI